MKFIDEAKITVRAGNGGAGSRHFRREKYIPMGGPDGGDGGRGGSILIVGDERKRTLLDFSFRPIWAANNGGGGGTNNRTGKDGGDLVISVPVGTQVLAADTGELVADITSNGQEFVLAKGGRGGRGNAFFRTATNQAPEHHQPGEPGESGEYTLSLKLMADVGLIGFPNAGKSSIIARISAARPKIADYPFTTLVPNLGAVRYFEQSFIVADIPGLIEGASDGKGLGIQFLKHVERARVLAHVVDVYAPGDEKENSAESAIKKINKELKAFSKELAKRPQFLVFNKIDLLQDAEKNLIKTAKKLKLDYVFVSAATGKGLDELVAMMANKLAKFLNAKNED